MLNYEIEKTGDRLNLELAGDLDIYSSDNLKKDLLEELDESVKILDIQAKDLEYIDSNGLGILMSIYNAMGAQEKNVKISGLKTNLKKIFLITDLDKVFDLEG